MTEPPEPTRKQPLRRPSPFDAADDDHTRIQPSIHSGPSKEGAAAAPDSTPDVGHTRIQGGPDTTGPAAVGPADGELPAEISPDYVVERRLAEGGEAFVYLARPTRTRPTTQVLPDLVAVKVYKPGFTVDVTILDKIVARGEFRYLPRLYAYGNTPDRPGHAAHGWEVMEYCQDGTLADVATPQPDDQVRAVVADLTDALEWLEQAGWRQMDFSPSNILLRRVGGHLELVIADLGGVVGTGESQQFGHVLGKLRYLAPEAAFAEERSAESAWWSLGMIAHELLTGRLPAAWANARNPQTLRSVLSTTEPEVDELPEAWRLAATGLLTKDKPYRWGAKQVRAWLAGKTPEVRRGTEPTPKITALRCLGVNYVNRTQFAVDLADHGERAIDWLTKDNSRSSTLSEWLRQDFADGLPDVQLSTLRVVAGDRLVAAHLIAELAATYAPHTRPRYRGAVVDAAGLTLLADDNIDLLVELLRSETLYESTRHECAHPTCAGPPCAVLRRVASEVPQIVARVEQLCGAASQTVDRVRIYREAVLLIADPQAARNKLPEDKRYEPAWWTPVRTRAKRARLSTMEGVVDVAAANLLAGTARTAIDTARSYQQAPPGPAPITGTWPAPPMRRVFSPVAWWASTVIWVGIVLATAHALGALLMLDVGLDAGYESRIWPEAWTFLGNTVGSPVSEFTAANPLPDPLSDSLAPLLTYDRARLIESWMLLALPILAFGLWLVSRRTARWGRRVAVTLAVALVSIAVLNAYANGARLLIVGLLSPLLSSGLGLAVLLVLIITVGWVTRRTAPATY